ncbi:baeRF2 domain-containing protein [Leucobacter sp.]
MSGDRKLAEVLAQPGPWTVAYVDGTGGEPQVVEEARQESAVRRLEEAGAPEADRRAVELALRDASGVPSPSARYLLVRGGEVVLDERFASTRRGPEVLDHGATPPAIPLLRHRTFSPRYLVVETTRDGADLRLERAGRAESEHEASVEGSTDALPKVQAGGWSHARWQRHSEEVWKHNQTEIAAAVDALVREHRPAFIAMSGDLRARQLLRERLSPDSAGLLVEVEANTRADGADEDRLDRAVADALDALSARLVEEALAHADAENGARRAEGVAEVVDALQQARVDTLLLDARLIDAEETLEVLDAEPWVAGRGGVPGAAAPLGRAPLAEALARAAVLTGAEVRVVEEPEREPGEERPERATPPPLAVLRWAEPVDVAET